MSFKLSVVVPVYNGMPYLKETLESLSEQTIKYELIIGDNCSTDGTGELLRSFCGLEYRYIKHNENIGIFGNLNELVTRASGDIIYILCADDKLCAPDSLEKLLNLWLISEPDTIAISCNKFDHPILKICDSIDVNENSDLLFYIYGNFMGTLSNNSFKRNIFFDVGGFNQSLPYAGDADFWIRLSKLGRIKLSTFVLHIERIHQTQSSHILNRNGELIEQLIRIYNPIAINLNNDYNISPTLIKLYGTLNYYALQLQVWFKNSRNIRGLKRFDEKFNDSNFIYKNILIKLGLVIITLFGRFGRKRLSSFIVNRYYK